MAGSETIQITMPQMGESVSEGTVLTWHKQEGDWVDKDETVVEVSTDKVDAEIPAPAAGKLGKILVGEDETIAVGAALGEIEVGAPDGKPAGAPKPEGEGTAGDGAVGEREPAVGEAAAATKEVSEAVREQATATGARPTEQAPIGDGEKITPVARRVAAAHGIDPRRVSGSGTGGRIVKEDVLAYIERDGGDGAAAREAPAAQKAPPIPAAPPGAQLLRGTDAMLARYMAESLKIPTATSFRTLSVATLDARRKQLNAALKKAGHEMKVSFTHLIGFAIVQAATDHPAMGHSFQEIDGKPHRVVPEHTSLGLAVDVQRDDGTRTLMVPVIKGAESFDFAAFREVYEDLIAKTRSGGLSPDDLQGASMTLTNPGGLGTVASVPRLMPGQGCIIATGAIGPPAGVPGAEKVMMMTSTYDHRVIQGAESGAFLGRIEQFLSGEDRFYESVFESLGVELPAVPDEAAPAPAPAVAAPAPVAEEMLYHVQAATSIVKAHRMHGHLAARLDPLGSEPIGDPALEPETVGLTPEVMEQLPARVLRIQVPGRTFAEALPHLRETYCGTIAYEIEHISDHQQRVWLRQRIESSKYRRPLWPEEKKRMLKRLAEVEGLETYLHRTFLGQKSFSIEGLDALIPMLDETLDLAARTGAHEALIGMAHRGRLNVLAHVVGRPYQAILAEFEGEKAVGIATARPKGGTGDVKYHLGAQGTYKTAGGEELRVTLVSNPSHLEFVDPVVEGRTRADQTDRSDRDPRHDPRAALPILIHGDAAFPGEGVVSETLNLQALAGYSTGGTIHIIANNQLGFTTEPEESRSTRYASDLAKGFDIPIVHVNADDPEACIAAIMLAMAFREEFRRGVVIDLIGYRRYGHNETDEPAYTQPVMYAKISEHPPVRKLYADALIKEGVISAEEAERQLKEASERLAAAHEDVKARKDAGPVTEEIELDRTASEEPETAVEIERLLELNREIFGTPEQIKVHRKLKPQREKRAQAGPDDAIDWGQAEALAFGSLLVDSVPLRLTGQDTARGTFSQRHLVLSDVETGERYAPIQNLEEAKAPFELYNSPLSEIAALGFEYGYSAVAPDALVMWEAQFGDFVNVAEVIIDQFMVSGLAKWGETSRLTLLLPHGYEGAGPEHSSARVERFLTLAAEGNIRIANVSTPAQYFHLLRRQGLISKRRPLVVFTPKSLLRNQQSFSALRELASGGLQRVIDDPHRVGDREQVTRLLLCSGRIYYDLVASDLYSGNDRVAVARIELLYPFPENEIVELIAGYPNLKEIVWVQEEPQNMGARRFMYTRARERELMPEGVKLGYVGRPYRASPGEGYPAAHHVEQERIVTEALG
jgi:2-oxoglutarate dehydrogenase E1 component